MTRQLNTTKRKLGDTVKFPTYEKGIQVEDKGEIVDMYYEQDMCIHIYFIKPSKMNYEVVTRSESEIIDI